MGFYYCTDKNIPWAQLPWIHSRKKRLAYLARYSPTILIDYILSMVLQTSIDPLIAQLVIEGVVK